MPTRRTRLGMKPVCSVIRFRWCRSPRLLGPGDEDGSKVDHLTLSIVAKSVALNTATTATLSPTFNTVDFRRSSSAGASAFIG